MSHIVILVFMTPLPIEREHMDVHRGEQLPCGNCSKLLASHCMLKAHQKGCIQGSKFICEECGQEVCYKARIETTYKGHSWS